MPNYADLEKLRAEFEEYDDGSIPVCQYKHKRQWYAKPLSSGTAQKLNMKGIQQHGRKWRVQKRSNGQLRKWTYGTPQEAQRKRDKVLAKVLPKNHWLPRRESLVSLVPKSGGYVAKPQ